MEPNRVRKCSVKLNRLSFNLDEILKQMLDQRVRECAVRVRRYKDAHQLRPGQVMTASSGGQAMRRCFIRLPRLNVVRSDISSPVASVISAHFMSDTEELDARTKRTREWVEK